jgi:hypothetical protein
MLNAVWVAVIAAACCFMVLAVVSVFVLMRLAGLITQTSAAVTGLRERSGEVIDRAHAAIDATAGQLARTDEITASMDEAAANMADLTGRVTALAPLARLAALSGSGTLARVPALLYGVRHAAQLRGAGPGGRPPGTPRERQLGGNAPSGRPSSPALGGRPPATPRERQLGGNAPAGRPSSPALGGRPPATPGPPDRALAEAAVAGGRPASRALQSRPRAGGPR